MLRSFSTSVVRHLEAAAVATNRKSQLLLPVVSSKHSASCLESASNRVVETHRRHFTTTSALLRSAAAHSSKQENARLLDTVPELEEFMAVFPDVVQDVTAAVNRYDRTAAADASNWLTRAILYNVPKGKRNRGLLTVSTFKLLQQQNEPSANVSDDIRRVQYLGWCVEMLQALFLIADDIMDHSLTRRGLPCWYKVPTVGMNAINDTLMIENVMFVLLRQHFGEHTNYVRLIELFHEAMLVTTIGESLDLQTAEKDLSEFTVDQYTAIVHNKTAFYSFYLPVAAAMLLAGHTDATRFAAAKEILYEIGHFFQVQDDYLDCFGDPAVTGKIGTDIQDKKCSWLAVQYMDRATDEQKAILHKCYGSKDEADVALVKSLYEQMGLKKLYAAYEERSYNDIELRIQQLPDDLPKSIFYQIMGVIYRRNH